MKKRRPPNVPLHDKTRADVRPTPFVLRGIVNQKPARAAKRLGGAKLVHSPQTRRGR